jgi:hypothetical protein
MEIMYSYNRFKRETRNYPSLYDIFQPGDIVSRSSIYDNKKQEIYKGIIMRINRKHLEIFWDMIDEKYQPENIDVNFTICSLVEIFEGSDKYTPIKREDYKKIHRFKLI